MEDERKGKINDIKELFPFHGSGVTSVNYFIKIPVFFHSLFFPVSVSNPISGQSPATIYSVSENMFRYSVTLSVAKGLLQI